MKDYRDRAHGLADLLNYGFMVEEGLMLLKDGSFCAGIQYQGPDMYTVTRNDLVSLRFTLHQAFQPLGDGWMLHSDLIRKEVNEYVDERDHYFPDATSAFIDSDRRSHFLKECTHFKSENTFVLTYKPPIELESKLQKFFIDKNIPMQSGWQEVLSTFKNKLQQIENSLSKTFKVHRLNTNDLLAHLHSCITGLHHPITSPKFPVFLDQILASKDFLGGLSPKIGQKQMRVLSINGFPLESHPGLLQDLAELPISFRWSNRFIFLDPLTSTQELKKLCRYWFQKRQGLRGLVKEIFQSNASGFDNQDALEMASDADSAVQEAESNLVNFGYYTPVFILTEEDETKLNEATQILIKAMEKKGFATRVETINAVEAYLGSLPGHGYQNVRRPLVSVFNLADFLPLLGLWNGDDYHPSPYYPKESPPLFFAQTQGKTPFRCSLHVNDVGHSLVIGDTGSGKSTLLGFLIAQHLRYKNAQVFLFDKGYSSFTLCHALGGSHYDIGGNGQDIAFSPLQHLDIPSELDWACEWLEIVYQSQGMSLSPLQRKEIRHSLHRLSKQPSRTLTDLQASVQDQALKAGLEFYTLSGTVGRLLDSNQDDVNNACVQVFEMEHLLNKEEKFALPVLNYLFHQINRRLDVEKPSLIIIEEGHRFLKGHFGQQLEVWLRECRKQNAAVVFVTQGLSEIMTSSYKHIVLNSCPTKIFLPNPQAGTTYNKELYYQIGLTDSQIDIIEYAIPKQNYYLVSPLGNRLMDLSLTPMFLTFMSSTNQEARDLILDLKEKYKGEWVYHYLKSVNLIKEAEGWMVMHQNNYKKSGVDVWIDVLSSL